MLLTIASAASDGLSLGGVAADIPRDGPALFIYAITAVSMWLIWQGSRTGDRRPSAARVEAGATPGAEAVSGAGSVDAPADDLHGPHSHRPYRTV